MSERTSVKLISSVAGRLASPSVLQGNGEPRPTSGGCGPSSGESFAYYDRDMSCWKMYQGSFLPGLATFSGTWPRSGTMRNGIVSARPSSGCRSRENGSLWLPTLPASEHRDWSRPAILARLDRGGRVARRICALSPQIHSVLDPVGLNPSFAEWMTGLPIGVDRIRGLGNTVVPDVAEWIGRRAGAAGRR